VLGQRRRHGQRTVRSVARSRNRPRPALAWFLLAILALLIALATRAAASPDTGNTALALEPDDEPITDETESLDDLVDELEDVGGDDGDELPDELLDEALDRQDLED